MDKTALVADVIDTWIDCDQNRPTLCFAVDRAHAKHLQRRFQEAGVAAGYIDAWTDGAERKEIEKDFHAGKIKVICNFGCLTTVIDWDVRCIILARPTKSEILFVQMIGRGLRTADGKQDCLLLDHSDNHLRLGFVTDIHHDHLDHGRERQKPVPKPREALPKKCPKCTFLKPPKVLICPSCGFTPALRCDIANRDGQLIEFASQYVAKPLTEDRASFYRELKHIALERGYNPGWIAHQFRQKYGCWPNGLEHLPPLLPSRTTLGWGRSRQIAYAKAMRSA
jgi:superfamily II DNA or RNA helicase